MTPSQQRPEPDALESPMAEHKRLNKLGRNGFVGFLCDAFEVILMVVGGIGTLLIGLVSCGGS